MKQTSEVSDKSSYSIQCNHTVAHPSTSGHSGPWLSTYIRSHLIGNLIKKKQGSSKLITLRSVCRWNLHSKLTFPHKRKAAAAAEAQSSFTTFSFFYWQSESSTWVANPIPKYESRGFYWLSNAIKVKQTVEATAWIAPTLGQFMPQEFVCKTWYFLSCGFILVFSYLDNLEPDGRCILNLLVRNSQ